MRESGGRSRAETGDGMSRGQVEALLGFALSDEQWGCVSAPLEPFVIVAGAGTGKTTVMAARVAWLVASGLVAEHEVLGLTFTNKAAAELAHRITTLLTRWRESSPAGPPGAVVVGEPTVATYHSFAARLIDEQGLRVGIEPGGRLLTGATVAQLAHGVVCRARGLSASRGQPIALAQSVLKLDANLAEQTITTEELRANDRAIVAEVDALARTTQAVREIRQTALRRIELADLVDELRAAKVRVGGLGFEDHMRLCVDLVRSSDELVATMRATYKIVLLDEYQDTSIAQRVILSTLFQGCPVTAVGDPMQAIYGWRSASVANIESFGQHFGRDGSAVVRVLSVNRRSGEPILAAANRVAADLRPMHPHIPILRAPAARGAVVRAALLPTVAAERSWLADQVAALVASGTPPEHIGVLARANDDLGPLRDALMMRGVPAAVSGTAAITASPFALAVLATLRVLADPADNTAVTALLAGPRWRIDPSDLERLASVARQRVGAAQRGDPPEDLADRLAGFASVPDPVDRPSLLEAAAHPGADVSAEARRRLGRFTQEMRLLAQHADDPLADLTAMVVATTGAGVEAELATAAGSTADVGLAGLLQLVEQFADADGRVGLGAFVAYLDAADMFGSGQEVEQPSVPGAVQLMTMHKAKGLEWPVVVLPHLCRAVFPGGKGSERWTTIPHVVPVELRDDRHVLPALAGWSTPDLDQFREACRAHDRTGDDRLAYVAVTRAREMVIASGHWWGPSQRTQRGPSPYLTALREQASDPADPWAEAPESQDGAPPANPMLDEVVEVLWPEELDEQGQARRRAADVVRALAQASGGREPVIPAAVPGGPALDGAAHEEVARTIAAWDAGMLAVLARTGPGRDRAVRVPDLLSASAAMALVADPDAFALDLLRPMPRRRNRWADLGTAFHAWVEARLGWQPLIADDDLPGAADEGVESPAELAALKESFERLPYAQRTPAGLEVPFSLDVGGRVIRGRIDAVFPADGPRWEVVDWKTSAADQADPLQLAIYRLAWAQMTGVPVDDVDAAFVFVRSGTIVRPEGLADAEEIARLLSTDPAAAAPAATATAAAAPEAADPDVRRGDTPARATARGTRRSGRNGR